MIYDVVDIGGLFGFAAANMSGRRADLEIVGGSPSANGKIHRVLVGPLSGPSRTGANGQFPPCSSSWVRPPDPSRRGQEYGMNTEYLFGLLSGRLGGDADGEVEVQAHENQPP